MSLLLPVRIESRILTLRGARVMIDADLAELYGVQTRRLNEQVKRNAARFPSDFMFQLNTSEKVEVVANCDHLSKLKFSKSLPYAFTEFGSIALANVLASPQAIEMSIYVVRAFVQLRQAAVTHADLAQRLTDLEIMGCHWARSRATRSGGRSNTLDCSGTTWVVPLTAVLD